MEQRNRRHVRVKNAAATPWPARPVPSSATHTANARWCDTSVIWHFCLNVVSTMQCAGRGVISIECMLSALLQHPCARPAPSEPYP